MFSEAVVTTATAAIIITVIATLFMNVTNYLSAIGAKSADDEKSLLSTC